jgi:hypothetical protein
LSDLIFQLLLLVFGSITIVLLHLFPLESFIGDNFLEILNGAFASFNFFSLGMQLVLFFVDKLIFGFDVSQELFLSVFELSFEFIDFFLETAYIFLFCL